VVSIHSLSPLNPAITLYSFACLLRLFITRLIQSKANNHTPEFHHPLSSHSESRSRRTHNLLSTKVHQHSQPFAALRTLQNDFLTVFFRHSAHMLHHHKIDRLLSHDHHRRMPRPCSVGHSLTAVGKKGTDGGEVWWALARRFP
jgi:hypothetical protein